MSSSVIAIIPCRYGSSRFPGKPLADLGGRPLLWHTHQRCASASQVDRTVVATDDARITQVCDTLGIEWVMTGRHRTGTDRVAEAASRIEAGIVVNVQGDEPFVNPAAIDAVIEALEAAPRRTAASNAYTPIPSPTDVIDHNVVKVTLRVDGTALMFSRQPIPYPHGATASYLRQLGLYAFTPGSLEHFTRLPAGPMEAAEGVEMLRFLEHSLDVKMVAVDDDGIAVDTPLDLQRARQMLGDTDGQP